MIATLQNMKRTVITAKKAPPYLYECFNVFPFHQNPLTFNTFACIQNAMIDAFIYYILYIFIIPDRDIINSADFFNLGVSELLGITVNWLAKQLERLIDNRKEQLTDKRIGALSLINPKIIWVKMLEHSPMPLND